MGQDFYQDKRILVTLLDAVRRLKLLEKILLSK